MLFVSRIELEDGANPDDLSATLAVMLQRSKVVHVAGAPRPAGLGCFYEEVAAGLSRHLAPGRKSTWGDRDREQWIEVRSGGQRLGRDARRPLHTDEASATHPAHVILMYCERAATRGGGNVFLDADVVAAALSRVDPPWRESLQCQPVCFAGSGESGTRVIFSLRDSLAFMAWDYRLLDSRQSAVARGLAERFNAFLEDEVSDDLLHLVDLEQGEAIIWWDALVLHGRAPAKEGGDIRYFRKTGISMDRFPFPPDPREPATAIG